METALVELVVAAVVFTGGHFLLSSRPVRPRLVAMLGEKPFQGIYSRFAHPWLFGVAPPG